MAELQPYKGGYYLWQYVPSSAAAVIFLILFLATTLVHFCKILWKTRTRFCLVFAVGGLYVAFLVAIYLCSYIPVEVIDFGARASAHNKTASLMPYCIQNVFTDPVRCYRLHGIRPYHPQHSCGTVFDRPGDLVDQDLCHGGRLLIPDSGYCWGIDGQWRQCESGAGYCHCWSGNSSGGVCPVHHYCRDLPDTNAPVSKRQAFDDDLPWKQHLYTLYTVSLLIMARSIFRVVEYAMGQDGYPLTHEWTLYVFGHGHLRRLLSESTADSTSKRERTAMSVLRIQRKGFNLV